MEIQTREVLSVIDELKPAPKKDEPEQLPEQKELGKFLTWGVALGAAIGSAWVSSTPGSQLGDDLVLPVGFMQVILAIALLLFVSTGNRNVRFFTRKRVLVIGILAVTLNLVNVWMSNSLTVESINPSHRLKGIGPATWALTPDALRAVNDHKEDHRYEDESVLLGDFKYKPKLVWTETSLRFSVITLQTLYLLGTTTLALSVIGAFNVYKMQSSSQSKRTRRQAKEE